MVNINLLPWRDAQRRARIKHTKNVCVAIMSVAALMVIVSFVFINHGILNQQERNAYLQSEIAALAKVVREIGVLNGHRDQLLARTQAIQMLQARRAQTVHVFDELVKKLPQGVYFDRIEQTKGMLKIDGKAQSNAQVSVLMRNLESSPWLGKTSLMAVDVIEEKALRLSQFSLNVTSHASYKNLSRGVENK